MFGQRHEPLLTPAMEHARRELDGYLDHAYAGVREAQARREELARPVPDREPPSDEAVERFRTFVTSHANTPEWQRVTERIDRGELNWRAVVEGLGSGTLDQDTAAAFESMSRVPPVELTDLTGPVERGSEQAERRHVDHEDEYYENFSLSDSWSERP